MINNFKLISKENLGRGKNGTTMTYANGLTIYYSYNTMIGVRYKGNLAIIENQWSTTTGGHLNAISRTEKRLEPEEFEKRANEIIKMALDNE